MYFVNWFYLIDSSELLYLIYFSMCYITLFKQEAKRDYTFNKLHNLQTSCVLNKKLL